MAEGESSTGPATGGPQPSGTEDGSDEGLIQTFLIADIRGYTRFSQDHGDEAAGKLAERYAGVVTEVVEARGGAVVELTGDEALCVFSTTRRAIRAAIDLQDRFVAESERDPTLPLPVGVGIDTGEAVPVGGGFRGRALNLAARLCAVARAGEILATREAVHMAGRIEGAHVEDRGLSAFKNIAEPVAVMRITGEGDDPARWFAERFPAQPVAGRGRSGRRRLVVIAAALAILVVAALVPIALRSAGPEGRIAGDALGIVDIDSGRLTGSVALDSRPGDVALANGSVWVTLPDRGEVVEIDAETRNIRDTIQVGADPSGIAVGSGSIWVSNSGSSTISRISLDTNRVVQTIPSPGGPAGIAVGEDGVWVANSINDSVSHIDAETGDVLAVVGVGDQPLDLVLDAHGLWVANASSGNVTLIDPKTEKALLSVTAGNGPHAIAAGLGGIWVSDFLDGTVTRIDPEKKAVSATFDIGGAPNGVAVGKDHVVVTDGSTGSVATIDPVSSSITAVPLGSHAGGLALNEGTAWVSVRGPEIAHQGGTLTVVAPSLDSIDPGLAYSGVSWSVLALGYDGLVGFNRVGGLDGGTLVPNLAVSIPTPTEGGRTYTFQLREGIRYSNGDSVGPEDFRRAIERVFTIGSDGTGFYSGVRGARQCVAEDPCDLSRGIELDDARRTITFHLVAPDPDFIYGQSLFFASPIPSGTPDTEQITTPIPTTGPYALEPFTEDESLSFVRNRYFRERPARPQGFPDRIEWRFIDDADQQVEEVLGGRADLTWQLSDRVPELQVSHAGQIYVAPGSGIFYMALNKRFPPFDHVRVRRALNLAVDREVIADLFEGRGTASCQIFPVAFPGYVPYCPYTRDPGRSWTAPDLAKARDLIDQSGTVGSRITVWATPPDVYPILPIAATSRYFVALLNELGYDARLKMAPQDEFDRRVFTSGAGVPMVPFGWSSDYAAESGYLPALVTCGSLFNLARFCDRGIERKMQEAMGLQLTDPLAAHELWSSIEHQVVDVAPIVPLVDRSHVAFVSERLGNYQLNPQWGPLIDQMWVR